MIEKEPVLNVLFPVPIILSRTEGDLKICKDALKEIQADTSYKWHDRLMQIDKIKEHADKALKDTSH